MFNLNYSKADSSTFIIKSVNGRVRQQGKGLSFWYNSATTSIAALPLNAQEAPFIFNFQTSDFQGLRIQGQISFQVKAPEKAAEVLNFNLSKNGKSYASEDPLKLSDRVVRIAQTLIQAKIQSTPLREALLLSQSLVTLVMEQLIEHPSLEALGIAILDVSIAAITPSPETLKALEAEARESLLKEADDAIYARRKFSVEQERTIKEAELETDLSVQRKRQEIEEARLENERTLLREQDIVARTGGEEFLLILPGTDLDTALVIAERLRMSVEQMQIEPIGSIHVSVGVSASSATNKSSEEVLKQADKALYQAKRLGRNRCEVYSA